MSEWINYIQSGQDLFGKLKIHGNIENAYYRSIKDWYNIDQFFVIEGIELVYAFAEELNNTVPKSFENNDPYYIKTALDGIEFVLELKDGSRVHLALY